MSTTEGLKPRLRASLAVWAARRSLLPDSLAYTMVIGSAVRGGAAGSGLGWAATCASRPARKPASQARWIGFAEPTTRLRRSISSSANGAVLGMGLSWLTMALSTAHHGTRGSV